MLKCVKCVANFYDSLSFIRATMSVSCFIYVLPSLKICFFSVSNTIIKVDPYIIVFNCIHSRWSILWQHASFKRPWLVKTVRCKMFKYYKVLLLTVLGDSVSVSLPQRINFPLLVFLPQRLKFCNNWITAFYRWSTS